MKAMQKNEAFEAALNRYLVMGQYALMVFVPVGIAVQGFMNGELAF